MNKQILTILTGVVTISYIVAYLSIMERNALPGTTGIGPWPGYVSYKINAPYIDYVFYLAHNCDKIIRPKYWLYDIKYPDFHGEWLNGDKM